MGAVLRCELCDSEPRLQLPMRYASLIVFHTVIDHGWPIERTERVHRMVLPSGETIWGLGSLGRKRAHVAVWRVRMEHGSTEAYDRPDSGGALLGAETGKLAVLTSNVTSLCPK